MTALSVNGIFASPLVRAARSFQDRPERCGLPGRPRGGRLRSSSLWVTPRALAGAAARTAGPGATPRRALRARS